MDAPLADRLRTFAEEVRALNPGFADAVERMVERLKAGRVGEDAPRPGEPMPDFLLPDETGRLRSLADFTARGPVVIAFHRGHWCPYCLINATALASIEDEVEALGASLVAVTPEIEQFNAELRANASAGFPILSDMDNSYALLLNLAFFVGEEKQAAMKESGWDFSPYQRNDQWMLPVPATFVVGQDGLVKACFIDPDYRKRMDTGAILEAIRRVRP